MKLTIGRLRKIIKEILKEEAWVPGSWMGNYSKKNVDKDLQRLGSGGFLSPLDEEEDDEDDED